MRIGFDARYVDDRYHGVGRFAYQTLEALTRLYPSDAFVVYHNPNRPSTRLDLAGLLARPNVEARAFPYDLYAPIEQPLLALALARARLDVHYVPYFPAPLLASIKLVVTVHDLILDHEPRYQAGRWVRYYYRPMMRLAPRRAARIVAVSRSTAKDLHSLYRVPSERIVVVPEAADPRFRPVASSSALATVRERYRLPVSFVLAVGVRRPHKNLAALVEAFALVANEIPHSLVLAGEAHARYSDDVPGTIARLGLADRVIELGHVPDADLPALYTLADVFVLPSLDEGFGLPALEAMACGTPVVASNTSSIPEVVGDAGLLVDPRDPSELARAIVRAVSDRELNARLRSLGLARAAEFDWSTTARLLRAVLDSAAGRPVGERGVEAMSLPDPRHLPYALLRRFPPPPGLFWRLARLANDSFLVGVSGVVRNAAGETLLFRHTYRSTPWGLPGGWMRRGESPFEAFEREVGEESGFEVRADRLLLIGTAPDRPKLDFVVGATLVGGSFRPSREVSAHRWADTASVALSEYDRTVLAEVARLKPGEVGRFSHAWSTGNRRTS